MPQSTLDSHSHLSFTLLHPEPLRPASILLGSTFSAASICAFALVMRIGALHPIEPHAPSSIESVLQRLNQPASPSQDRDSRARSPQTAASYDSKQAVSPAGTASPALPMSDAPSPTLPSRNPAPTALPAGILSRFVRPRLPAGATVPLPSAARPIATTGAPTPAPPGHANAAASQPQAEPQNATQFMIQAISTHQVVMFGETHGNKQEYDWLCKLVQAPAFADRVDDIVVEFGNSLYQKTVDRYIAGEDIPQPQIEKAWRNMIGAVGPVSPVYGWFYQAVRESNRGRRDGHKIRLLLGDPYGDWSKINNAEDLGPYLAHRDEWYADVVQHDVLAQHHHALLIMGAGHFLRRNGPGLVEKAILAAGVQPYLVVFGTNAVGAYDHLDHHFDAWSLPAIVPLSGTWVGELPANPVLTGGVVAPNSQTMKDVADAMLYVGSRDTLTQVLVSRSQLVDTAYGKEIERRLQIQTGRTMDFTESSEAPQYQKPPQQVVSNGIHRLPPNPPKSINDPLPPRPPSQ